MFALTQEPASQAAATLQFQIVRKEESEARACAQEMFTPMGFVVQTGSLIIVIQTIRFVMMEIHLQPILVI